MSRSRRQRSSAQAIVEFALVGPLFFMMLLGVFEVGRAVWTSHELTNGTREAGRFAVVNGSKSGSPATVAQLKTKILDTTAGLTSGSLNVSATGLGGDPGTTVTITSSYNYDVLVGIIPGLSDFTMTRTSKVIIHH